MAGEWVLLEGVKYLAPFLCMCCGREVEARQWAFGMACGLCDTGICQTWHDHHRPEHAHAEPVWRPHAVGDSRTDKVARFMDYANHEFRVAAAAGDRADDLDWSATYRNRRDAEDVPAPGGATTKEGE